MSFRPNFANPLAALARNICTRDKYARRYLRSDPKLVYPDDTFGKWTYGIPTIHRWSGDERLKVGAFCSIAAGVQILLGGEHRTDWVTTWPFANFWRGSRDIVGHPKSKGDVVIGNDVWIAHESLILSGVRIGDGAVIGARAVVGKDVPPYHIVAGNPARIVRARFTPDIVERLLAVAWWTWDDVRIERAAISMSSGDVVGFLERCQSGEF